MNTVSLFSGAGGLDVGFKKAGFNIIWANDYNKDACDTYSQNIGNHIKCGDIKSFIPELSKLTNVDVVIGGPPCQGFSVAGKMDPNDPRSEHVWNYLEVVKLLSPKIFVMENVKALGKLAKWEPLRTELLSQFRALGYSTNFVILNATEFNVPQARERVFFIGFKGNDKIIPDLNEMFKPYKKVAPTVRQTLSVLDRAGTGNNKSICKAKITFTTNPVMRKSPYAGMMFNGLGRPVRIDGYCATLPASMGGNKTPIIDEEELYDNKEGWILKYHSELLRGNTPMKYQVAPKRLRRLTVEESTLLQTFPIEYKFSGSQSSVFKQIGNAVPCNLGQSVGELLMSCLENEKIENSIISLPYQMKLVI